MAGQSHASPGLSSSPPPYDSNDTVLHDSTFGSQNRRYTKSPPSQWRDRPDSPSTSRSMSSDLELGRLQQGEHVDSHREMHFQDEDTTPRKRARSTSGLFAFNHEDGKAPETEAQGNQAFMRKVTVNGTLISLWYIFSVCISVYNKWMFSGEQLDFQFPLFTTSLHMVVQFSLAFLVLLIFPRLRPQLNILNKSAPASTGVSNELDKSSKPLMTPWYYLTHVAPCGAATGLDIGLGNTSFRLVTLVFFTMCKSSTLGFVLLFAILFGLEKASWKLAGIIVVMSAGVIMMVAGETKFSGVGFALLMSASFFSGLRWSLTQMLLKRNPATSNPFSSLFFLTPIMFLVLLVIAIPVEGFEALGTGLQGLSTKKGGPMTALILITPGILAFLMVSSEFALLQRTSVVTLSVCGIFKEVITIAAGGIIFGEQLTPINISGLIVTIIAIAGYNYIRVTKMKRDEQRKTQDTPEEQAPMLAEDALANGHVVEDPVRRFGSGHVVRRSLSGSIDESSITTGGNDVDRGTSRGPTKAQHDLD